MVGRRRWYPPPWTKGPDYTSLETVQTRTDHLPDRVVILRDKMDETLQLLADMKTQMEYDRARADDAQHSSPSGWQQPASTPAPAPTTSAPTMLNLDEQVPMTMGRPVLTPLTLPDGRVNCIPSAMLSQMLGGAL
ncbi:hypothetical protein AK812_SmicGene46555 [Symbiodinium microadriaticum]|uniref:Uncharacterized protein n=1 Tax=Symbiodinium microadriaticum TaxID=2951 RepID=A0A1Q9BTM2_SYMMI|nr:hypothetical protein AK812_SmicGene46555 [Symbiodinium microadriaticum]